MPKVLHLTVKKKWFDLIASGRKKKEYRKASEHWKSRFLDKDGFAITYDEIVFRNGYRKDSPTVRVKWLNLGTMWGGSDPWIGEWGEGVETGDFCILLGDVLDPDGKIDSVEHTKRVSLPDRYTLLGTATTVGELRELLASFTDDTSFGFINQPLQSLFARKCRVTGAVFVGFQ